MTDVLLEGPPDLPTAFSAVNRAWLSGLRAAGFGTSPRGMPDVLIHHDFREPFGSCRVGEARFRIAVRPWDFGPYPRSWAERIGTDFDRLWVHSGWIRDKAIEGGVDPERVSVVPLGHDPEVFSPDGPAMDLGETFNFLFVGATVARKGIDILLKAYAEAFCPGDPVCLILKGNAEDVFYRGERMEDVIASFRRDPARPALRHLDAYLADRDLASLYRAADVGVFPYRAEGFALPILEAMACGLPCIVPRFGACLDYCSEETAFLVEARRLRLPVGRDFAYNSLGFRERVGSVDICHIPVGELAGALRGAFDDGEERRRARGARAAVTVRESWTWSHSVDTLVALLQEAGWAP